jgi:hypothetical protein
MRIQKHASPNIDCICTFYRHVCTIYKYVNLQIYPGLYIYVCVCVSVWVYVFHSRVHNAQQVKRHTLKSKSMTI